MEKFEVVDFMNALRDNDIDPTQLTYKETTRNGQNTITIEHQDKNRWWEVKSENDGLWSMVDMGFITL